MPERKQDISEERRQQILAGALRVFSQKGFVQATNREIAEAAGINSPGLIYHYFASKANLLRAVIDRYAPPAQLLARADELMDLPPDVALRRIGNAYLQLIDDPDMGDCTKLLAGEALRNPEFAKLMAEIGPLRMLRFVSEYLKHQMDAGQLRPMDPVLAARSFMGPLVIYLLSRKVMQMPALSDEEPRNVVEATVDLFLRGLQPRTAPGEES